MQGSLPLEPKTSLVKIDLNRSKRIEERKQQRLINKSDETRAKKPLVKVTVLNVISATEATLSAEIPSKLSQMVEFVFNVKTDTPEDTATEMVGYLNLAESFIKPIALEISQATEELRARAQL